MVTARELEPPPPLNNGDHLTSYEFERRYAAMPGLKKAELIEGEVSLASPVSLDHSEGMSIIGGWLFNYRLLHPNVRTHTDGSVRLDPDNNLQPDAFIWRPGLSKARPGTFNLLDGAPDLVIEVAASSVSKDLFEKKHAYQRNGVTEYIVWRILDQAVDWFELRNGEYLLREPGPDGVIESSQLPRLRLNIPALLSGELAAVIGELR